jgi:hypothetical protein
MRQLMRSGWISTMVVVACWRGVSELLARQHQLAASGVLEGRLESRRAARIGRALGRRGRADVEAAPARVLAAVHVGSVSVDDLDDVALLEGAMRRAARDRVVRGKAGRACRTDWGALAEPPARARAKAAGHGRAAQGGRVEQWWPVPVALVGVAATFAAIVRPFAEHSPWLAAAGISIVLASWLAARRD